MTSSMGIDGALDTLKVDEDYQSSWSGGCREVRVDFTWGRQGLYWHPPPHLDSRARYPFGMDKP